MAKQMYQSVEERPEPIKAKVTGSLPGWLEGSLYRNGPGKFDFGNDKFNHWFDGMALLHRFHIYKGKVTYQSRYLNSNSYMKNKGANRIVCSEWGTLAVPDPCKTLYERFFSYFQKQPSPDNCLVNVFPIGDSLFTATELNILHRIDPETLETLDKIDLEKLVAVNRASAHPHLENDGTLHNLGAVIDRGFKYSIIKLLPAENAADGNYVENAEIVAKIPPRWRFYPSYFHSFAMTEHYYVFLELPLVFNVFKLFTRQLRGTAFGDALEWWPGYQTKLHIIDQKTGQRVNPEFDYVSSAMMTFHHANAYEDEDQLVIDVCGYTEGHIIEDLKLEKLQQVNPEEYLKGLPRGKCWRYVLPLKVENKNIGENLVTLKSEATAVLKDNRTVFCQYEVLSDEMNFEFPQINYKAFNGKKYKYVYGCGYKKTFLDCLNKLDVSSKQVKTWYTEGHFPSEPVFVSAPNALSEDDGVVLSVVIVVGESPHAYLLVLDAKSWNELARARVDVQLCKDLHGTFVKT